MNDDLHRHLDGEIPPSGLSPESRREAEAWERVLQSFRIESAPPSAAPPWLEGRIMAEIEALPEPGILKRWAGWLLSPRAVRVSPLTAGLVTLAVVALLLVGRTPWGPPSSSAPMGRPGSGTVATAAGGPYEEPGSLVYVQFALEAPGATSVAVAGDFDDWAASFPLEDLDGDGVWSGRVPVRPGVHAYMFLVNGSTWMTDPNAERYAEDGFGNRNAILAVAAPVT